MKSTLLFLVPVAVLICSAADGDETPLPKPDLKGKVSVEEAIYQRRSIRGYGEGSLTLKEVSQLLWSALGLTVDGVTGPTRSHPSAGGLYPLEIFAVVGDVESLEPGIYRYDPIKHSVLPVVGGDRREELRWAALGQRCISEAPLDLIIAAVFERTTGKYGERGMRYVLMDLGASIENIFLQAQSLGLGTVVIGAFYDEKVKRVLGGEEDPLAIMPVGRR